MLSYLDDNWSLLLVGSFWGFIGIGRLIAIVNSIFQPSGLSTVDILITLLGIIPTFLAFVAFYGIIRDKKYGYFSALAIPLFFIIFDLIEAFIIGSMDLTLSSLGGIIMLEIPVVYLLYSRHYSDP